MEIGHIKPNSELFWLRVNANPLFRDADLMPYMVVAAFEEMTEKTKLELEMRKQALTDPLTSAGNRRVFMDRFQQLFALARRIKIPASLLMLDINGFKAMTITAMRWVTMCLLPCVNAFLQHCVAVIMLPASAATNFVSSFQTQVRIALLK